jgi:rhodanese-related sulfurtransferase
MGMNTKDTSQTQFKRNQILILVVVLIILGISVGVMLIQVSGSNLSENIALIENRQVTVEEAFQFYQEEVYFLDVRTPMEWQAGHIPGATLIPLDELAVRSGELPVNEPILIYCRSGNRSLQAMNLLDSVGFMNLSSMDGGIEDWITAGYPLEWGE